MHDGARDSQSNVIDRCIYFTNCCLQSSLSPTQWLDSTCSSFSGGEFDCSPLLYTLYNLIVIVLNKGHKHCCILYLQLDPDFKLWVCSSFFLNFTKIKTNPTDINAVVITAATHIILIVATSPAACKMQSIRLTKSNIQTEFTWQYFYSRCLSMSVLEAVKFAHPV